MKSKFVYVFALMAFVLPLVVCAQTVSPAGGTTSSTPVSPAAMSTGTNGPAAVAKPLDGRRLFLHNCAHCHGADATGDDGPDLHHLDLSDDWIANRIQKGKAGQMTAFAGKLQPGQINALVAYVQSLK